MRKLLTLYLIVLATGCSAAAQYSRVDYPWGCTNDGRPHPLGCHTLGYRVSTMDLDAVEAISAVSLCPEGVQDLIQDPCKHETLVVCKEPK
jgi:hypothetical protein